MNDFTIDELRFIWNRLAITDYTNAPDMVDLANKVCAMIDNYCEHECQHESDGYDYFKIKEDELLLDVLKTRACQLKCKRCGQIY